MKTFNTTMQEGVYMVKTKLPDVNWGLILSTIGGYAIFWGFLFIAGLVAAYITAPTFMGFVMISAGVMGLVYGIATGLTLFKALLDAVFGLTLKKLLSKK